MHFDNENNVSNTVVLIIMATSLVLLYTCYKGIIFIFLNVEIILNILFQSGLLGVFQKLVASKTNDHEGFYLLNCIVEHMPP